MSTTNHQLAAIFNEMADLMGLLDVDSFRINAYRKVAQSLQDTALDVRAIGPDQKKLREIPGVGEGSAKRIAEFLDTGKITDHEELKAQVPAGLPAMLNLQGLGPRGVALLWKEGGVTSLDDLKKKLDDGSLAGLKGMGEKKLENLKKSLAFVESGGRRVRIGEAMPQAQRFVEALRAVPGVKQAAYAGSLRRGKETIGDVDLLVACAAKDAPRVHEAFTRLDRVEQVLAHGETKSSIRTFDGLQADLRTVEPASFGAALLYFTGSKEHNIRLRQRAIKDGMTLNEYGLFKGEARGKSADKKPDAGEEVRGPLVAGKSEEDVYRALGLDWIPPELREAYDEIELAAAHKLPKLVALGDIKAELHSHTTASDGRWTIRELAETAFARGFHTIAVTDHSVSQFQANGLKAERLEQHIEEVRAVAAEMKKKIAVLAGSEVDILADGKLDYPNSLLKELDVVVASPHAALSQEPAKATERIVKAIENPYVTIIGHPTGRLVMRREGLAPDMKAIVEAAAARKIALEINANSYRLDLRDTHARLALEHGVKLAINTDAHSHPDLDQLIYGVLTARRAAATAGDIVNTYDRDALLKWIRSTRGV